MESGKISEHFDSQKKRCSKAKRLDWLCYFPAFLITIKPCRGVFKHSHTSRRAFLLRIPLFLLALLSSIEPWLIVLLFQIRFCLGMKPKKEEAKFRKDQENAKVDFFECCIFFKSCNFPATWKRYSETSLITPLQKELPVSLTCPLYREKAFRYSLNILLVKEQLVNYPLYNIHLREIPLQKNKKICHINVIRTEREIFHEKKNKTGPISKLFRTGDLLPRGKNVYHWFAPGRHPHARRNEEG